MASEQPDYFQKEFHLMLLTGRLLVQYSAATERVHRVIEQLAGYFAIETRLFVDYKTITLTLKIKDDYSSRFSRSIPYLTINMGIVTQIFRLIEQIKHPEKTLDQALEKLEKISKSSFSYPRALVVFILGITAGSLAKIFDGDWPSFLITGAVWILFGVA
ncbi:putative integral membrane protein [Gloeothece citriformis PCC 7424]|uniref:Putative integral membrane protein n=1 Tax=Gloeothece citriformis (strain PCC 7424) TaxID=65393 RepID=B7KA04_GLOC7|nr:threonine/serine exporter family protein [Gloeothece citriformis]ACK71360.1 putative integral membrane protein [Gloeothece citriformis PCC 7424]